LFLISFESASVFGQDFYFHNIPLSSALTEVSKKLNVDIAFDAQKLSTVKIDKEIADSNVDAVLNQLLTNSGFTFSYLHGSYLIVEQKIEKNISKPKTYRITGTISDIETGEGLPYTSVNIVDKNITVFSSSDGTFGLNYVETPLKLKIQSIDFFSLDTVLVLSDNNVDISLKLKRRINYLPSVVVPGNQLKIVQIGEEAGHITFSPSNFENLPNGYIPDVFRTLQLLPGISNNENSAELNIRGGSADENLILLDGFTLYNVDHFFGQFSAVNPAYIKDIQIFRGGFDSKYGERVSAIIDITGKSGVQNRPMFYGGINFISANAGFEIPLGKKITFVADARRTYNNLYSTSLFSQIFHERFSSNPNIIHATNAQEVEPDYYFYDFNAKLNFNISEKGKISISGFGSKDYLELSNVSQSYFDTVTTQDKNRWENYGISASWTKQHSNGVFSDLQIGYSGYSNWFYDNTKIQHTIPIFNPRPIFIDSVNITESNEKNKITDYFLSDKNTYSFNLKNTADFGFQIRQNSYTYLTQNDSKYIYTDLKQSAILSTVFFQDKRTMFEKISVKPGFRLNYYSNTSKFYIEPRFSANYHLARNVELKFAAGKYYQFLNKVSADQQYGYNRDFWILSDNSEHPVLESTHFILGSTFRMNRFLLDIEAYSKLTKGIQEFFYTADYLKAPPPNLGDSGYHFASGSGTSKGMDVMLKYESKFYTGWLSYSLSKTNLNFADINHGNSIPAPYDQMHKLDVANLISYRKWTFSLLCIFSTGQPYIIEQNFSNQFQASRRYSRLPNYRRVDFSTNYLLKYRKINLKLGFSVVNLFNFTNYYTIYTREFDFQGSAYSQNLLIKAQGITPNVMLEFSF
jgi:hypothetical protein